MGGHYGEGDLEACEVVETWMIVKLGRCKDGCLEVVNVVSEEEDGVGGQGRSPRDHLGYERSPLLSSTHKYKKLPSSLDSQFLHS